MISSLRINNVDITKRIKALLALRGENTLALARALGVSQPTLSYRLTGKRNFDGLCTVERIAAALGVPVSTLELGAPWPDVTEDEC
jgi:transcriptional regulator with XRE-family HTH domain